MIPLPRCFCFPQGIPGAVPLPATPRRGTVGWLFQVGPTPLYSNFSQIVVAWQMIKWAAALPSSFFPSVFFHSCFRFLNHHQGARPNQGFAIAIFIPRPFLLVSGRLKHGQYGTDLSMGPPFNIPQLKGSEITARKSLWPRAGQCTGNRQESFGAYGSRTSFELVSEHHNPRKHRTNCGTTAVQPSPYPRCRFSDTTFCKVRPANHS